jgi:hypothetical protein
MRPEQRSLAAREARATKQALSQYLKDANLMATQF